MTVRRKMNLYAAEAQEFSGCAWEAGADENDGGNDLNVPLLQQFFKTKASRRKGKNSLSAGRFGKDENSVC